MGWRWCRCCFHIRIQWARFKWIRYAACTIHIWFLLPDRREHLLIKNNWRRLNRKKLLFLLKVLFVYLNYRSSLIVSLVVVWCVSLLGNGTACLDSTFWSRCRRGVVALKLDELMLVRDCYSLLKRYYGNISLYFWWSCGRWLFHWHCCSWWINSCTWAIGTILELLFTTISAS